MVKNLPANAEDKVSIPGPGRSPREGKDNPPHYSCLRNPWAEEPGGLQSLSHKRVMHDLVTKQQKKFLFQFSFSYRFSKSILNDTHFRRHPNLDILPSLQAIFIVIQNSQSSISYSLKAELHQHLKSEKILWDIASNLRGVG